MYVKKLIITIALSEYTYLRFKTLNVLVFDLRTIILHAEVCRQAVFFSDVVLETCIYGKNAWPDSRKKKLEASILLSCGIEITSEGTGISRHSSKNQTRVDVYDSCTVYTVAF